MSAKELRELSYGELVEMRKAIEELIAIRHEDDYATKCIKAANEVMGVDILSNTRKRDVVVGRWFVIDELSRQGYTEYQLATLLGLTHATVNHGKKMMRDMIAMSAMYQKELIKLREFKTILRKWKLQELR